MFSDLPLSICWLRGILLVAGCFPGSPGRSPGNSRRSLNRTLSRAGVIAILIMTVSGSCAQGSSNAVNEDPKGGDRTVLVWHRTSPIASRSDLASRETIVGL